MQNKLGRKEALELIVRLLDWLASNPDKEKWDWPEWQINGGKVGTMLGLCPACENARRTTGDGSLFVDCDDCILAKLWVYDKSVADLPCQNPASPYQSWKKAQALDCRSALAKQIADYARKELK